MLSVAPWQERRCAAPPRLEVVDLWSCPLEPGGKHPPEDVERAAPYRFVDDAAAFLSRRRALRRVLGGALDCDPMSLVFATEAGGRPRLVGEGSSWLGFSASSSDSIAVVAVARDRQVGVDVEAELRELPDPAVVDRMFSKAERARVNRTTFASCWTMKEALVKALGVGLALDLRSVEVVAAGPVVTSVVATAYGESEPVEWTVSPVPMEGGYAAAVAVAGAVHEIRCFDLRSEP